MFLERNSSKAVTTILSPASQLADRDAGQVTKGTRRAGRRAWLARLVSTALRQLGPTGEVMLRGGFSITPVHKGLQTHRESVPDPSYSKCSWDSDSRVNW